MKLPKEIDKIPAEILPLPRMEEQEFHFITIHAFYLQKRSTTIYATVSGLDYKPKLLIIKTLQDRFL
jgi:hypothetical protein